MMQLNKLVLTPVGVAKLTPEERTFLALAGQFSNDLTILHKLMTVSFREPPDELEHMANFVLVGVLLKTLAAKLCQGWEVVEKAFYGAQVGKAEWLRTNAALQTALDQLRLYFSKQNPIAEIRNRFGSHYDTEPLAPHLDAVLADSGFEMLCGDRVANYFYTTSESATWSSILGTTDEGAFRARMNELVHEVASKAGDFFEFLNRVAEAFCTHVVRDLGGELVEVSVTEVACVGPNDALLPLFAA
jgi:hypothetical protein